MRVLGTTFVNKLYRNKTIVTSVSCKYLNLAFNYSSYSQQHLYIPLLNKLERSSQKCCSTRRNFGFGDCLHSFIYNGRRSISSSLHAHKGYGSFMHGRRCFPDHRGNINASNRPDSDFIATEDDPENVLDDVDYSSLIHDATGLSAGVVNRVTLEGDVYVVLPWIKWGPMKKTATTEDLLLDEACALANSLSGVNVVGKEVVKIKFERSDELFGPGQLERIAANIQAIGSVSTVFISTDVLSINQIRNLEYIFGCRVIDRYWIVLALFHQHATTLEAKMQVALAELPYIRGHASHSTEKNLLDNRIVKLKAQLAKLNRQREHVRSNRSKYSLPCVAVIGYTNAGKTSLISALSGDSSVQGRDQLFATLDVTAHASKLPCGLQILLLDTVGFIQDLPTTLVTCFNATIQDAANADVIVHIRDLSHPDYLMHHSTVMSALYSIKLPHTTPIITLDNKADLEQQYNPSSVSEKNKSQEQLSNKITDEPDLRCSYLSKDEYVKNLFLKEADYSAVNDPLEDDVPTKRLQQLRTQKIKDHFNSVPSIVVSAKTKQGLLSANLAIEEQVLRATDKKLYRMSLPTGGPHLIALRKIADVSEENILQDTPEKTSVICIMDVKQLARFKKICKQMKEDK